MPDAFAIIDDPTAQAEGGYVNNPDDPGGETNHGITARIARVAGYTGAMRDLTAGQAADIRRSEFFIKPGLDRVAELSVPVAAELYDTGINMGQGVAATFFQRALNVLNRRGVDYPDVKVDGGIGPATLAAFAAYLKRNGAAAEHTMLNALNGLQAARYIEICEGREASETFANGWLSQRVGF